MCPLRLILLFLSATLAGFFLLKNLKSSTPEYSKSSNEAVPLEESSPSASVPRSKKVFSAICCGFWTCVDMASGRYLWRNLASSSSSKKQS